jgi:hypothetical protein
MTATRELEVDTPAGVLEHARALRATADRAEADLLAAGVDWASLHAGDQVVTEADWLEASIPLAGAGAPQVAEFCVAEFALAVGLSTDAGRRYLGQALELFHRLPEMWARVQAGDLPAWRARRIADATMSLSMAAAGFVDRHVAPFAHRVGLAALDRLVEEARVRFDPEEAEYRAAEAAEHRHATVHLPQVDIAGSVEVSATVDLPDAIDLEHLLQAGAAQLAADGSTAPLDVRRAQALGLLARGQLTLNDTGKSGPTRRIVLHVHAAAEAVASGLVRVEETSGFVLIDTLAAWCTDPATQVDVHPVIDLADHIHVEAYEVPDRLATQANLRDRTCVFPHCTRRARRCDHDHVIPHERGGPTCSCNIAPLCRGHHRLKTHGGWSYRVLEPGCYLWTSPHGYTHLRDHTGTRDVTPAPTSDARRRPGEP